jgi:hypothetical protein
MSKPTEQLERWESWPLWALGLSNGLNIALWYVLSMARIEASELPIRVLPQLKDLLPLIVTAGGIAAAVSLDGVLIATIAGTRHGRRGLWSWLTIVGACGFSAGIAYTVHAGSFSQVPGLHVAQAVVLALYNLHLSQRKTLQDSERPVSRSASSSVKDKTRWWDILGSRRVTQQDGFKCSKCDASLPSLNAVRLHQRDECPGRLEALDLHHVVPGSMQPNGHHSSDDAV